MKIIAIANQKGGVGKTTTAVNLAAGLALAGYRTLLLDLDSQCNSTLTWLPPELITTTLAEVLIAQPRQPLSAAIYETGLAKLELVPAHIRLTMLERMVALDEQYRLKNALLSVADNYDLALLDCPPSLGLTLTAALLAATHVLIPVAAQYYPLEGVIDLAATLAAARQPNPALQVLGYLLTDCDARTKIAGEAQQKLQQLFPGQVLATVIRSNVRLQTAPAYRQSIYEHAPDSHGAADYQALTAEVIAKLQLQRKEC